jgi:hypothetical protein
MNRILALVIASSFACGPKPAATKQDPDPKQVAQPTLPDVAFSELDLDQRAEFMKQMIVPAMAPLFRAHNATKYAEFGCPTCHGEGATDGDFDMPNEKLPVLDFADMSKFKPADIEWMKNKIKPAMAVLLREQEHTAEHPSGFGCLNCHTAAGTGN